MEIKREETNEQRIIKLLGILSARVEELESKVAELEKEKEDTEAGVFYEGNEDFKNHIFNRKGDK